MFIDTTTFAGSTQAVDVTFPMPSLDEAGPTRSPAHVTGTLTRVRHGFRLAGRLETDVRVACARCDEPFALALDTAFALQYSRRSPETDEAAAGEELELRQEDCTLAELDARQRIDLLALAKEQAYLSLPLKPICRDDCRGLCLQCGVNLNRTPCACPEADADPRLGTLADLKRRLTTS